MKKILSILILMLLSVHLFAATDGGNEYLYTVDNLSTQGMDNPQLMLSKLNDKNPNDDVILSGVVGIITPMNDGTTGVELFGTETSARDIQMQSGHIEYGVHADEAVAVVYIKASDALNLKVGQTANFLVKNVVLNQGIPIGTNMFGAPIYGDVYATQNAQLTTL